MNKISKKIVSLITMAAFVLTLVPAAAFAASEDKTGYTVDAVADKATVNITLSDTDLSKITSAKGNVLVWAEDAANKVVAGCYPEGTKVYPADGDNQMAVLTPVAGTNEYSLDLTFAQNGTYKVYVALNDNDQAWIKNVTEAKTAALEDVKTVATPYADLDYSGYGVVNRGVVAEESTVEVGDTINTGFVVNYDYNTGTKVPLDNVWVWAEDKDGDVANVVSFGGSEGSKYIGQVDNDTVVKATFSKDGAYTLRAGVGATLEDAQANLLKAGTFVTVSAEPVVIEKLDEAKATINNDTKNPIDIDFTNNIGNLDLTADGIDFDYDGIDTITVTGVAKDEDGNGILGKTLTVTTNKDTVVEFDNDENNAVKAVTDNFGEFEFSFKMPNKENATITIVNEEDNISYTIQIWAVKSTAKDISRTLTDGYVLAGNDTTYNSVYNGVNADNPASFADAVQFKITDQQGEEMTGKAATANAKIDVRSKAKNSTLEDKDLALIWDEDAGVYTLGYTNGESADNWTTDLVPGKYEVRVALPSTDGATVTFNVAKFGKVQDTVLAVTARDYDQSPANPNEEVMTVDDTITLGQMITVKAKYVDENGLKVDATNDVSFNFNGKAVSDWKSWNNRFATQKDIPANESLIGTTVKVVAFNADKKQLVEKTLTVADSYTDKSLEFSSDSGAVSKDNKVTVSVVDADGKVQQVEGSIDAWVADQSNEDAKISVDAKDGRHAVQNGKGTLTVYSDQETTADIVVVVKAGTEAYYGTLEYTFGSEDALANRTVVMTIDSTEYVVNNKIITGDAAPYIDSNWRTMVPIRALAESFDAEVIWNQDDSTVTINFDGDTQIVMTVGETAYTVDGAEATMDTEPVNAGDRVYVPVRFAAEGLGFSVLPLYNEAGLTASVVFQK